MIATVRRWLVPALGRVLVALVVLVSANHCFLEEGLSGAEHKAFDVTRSASLDYHFGAAFPHQHSTTPPDDHGEAQHPHGDAMSTHSEGLFLKHRKADQKLGSLVALPSLVISFLARSGYPVTAGANQRALPQFYDCEKSLASLTCAAQAPPRLV